MMKDSLHLISNEHSGEHPPIRKGNNSLSSLKLETEARFERLWLNDPEQFNPQKTLLDWMRIERTKTLLDPLASVNQCVDLGCGYGELSRYMADKGWEVTAVDIARNALNRLNGIPHIHTVQDYIPDTKLADKSFDLVLCTDLIAYINKKEYRLLVSELVRLCTHEGIIVCSTPIDIHSDNALDLFTSLMETEIIIEEWRFSYHRLSIRTLEILRKLHMNFLADPLSQSTWFMEGCEKISKLFWGQAGISHAIFKGRKKPLMPLPPKDEQPIERKQKHFVWE